MKLVKNQNHYKSLLVQYFENLKILVFLSPNKVSQEFENALKESEEDFDDADILLLLIKEDNKETLSLFEQYEIKEVPSVIFLSPNLSVSKKLSNCSPGDILIAFEDQEATFNKQQKEQSQKFEKLFSKFLVNNKLLLFKFSQEYNKEFDVIKKTFDDQFLSYKILTAENFKENNHLTILSHFMFFMKKQSSFDFQNSPIAYINQNIINNQKECLELLEIHKDLFEFMKTEEKKKFQSLIDKTPIVLFVNKACQDYENQQKVLNQLEQEKVIFTYLDLNEKQSLLPELKKLVNSDILKFPILKNSKNEYYDNDQMKENFVKELIDKKFIADSIDNLIKYLINSQKIFVFIKGSPEFPQCKFTRKMVNYLNSKKTQFGFFNILTNFDLREQLKIFSNWKTYPQLYINGKLIGGNDIVAQLEQAGEMDKLLSNSQQIIIIDKIKIDKKVK